MKSAYLWVSIGLLLLAGWFARLHLAHVPLPPEPLLAAPAEAGESRPDASFRRSSATAARRASLAKLTERNPFSPSGAGGAADAGGTGGDLGLVGVIRAGDELQGALIRDRKASSTKFWCVGETLPNGFVVREVQADRVVLRRRAEEQVLVMAKEPHRSAAAATAVAMPPAKAVPGKLPTKPAKTGKAAGAEGAGSGRAGRASHGERSGGLFPKGSRSSNGGKLVAPAPDATRAAEPSGEELEP